MVLLDTNVLIYASEPASPFCSWARKVIADEVSSGGAGVNAAVLAELAAGDAAPETIVDRIRGWGVSVLDVPAAAGPVCGKAYAEYRRRRKAESGLDAPRMPLPDFFIGAHAEIMRWPVATADVARFQTCFPSVRLIVPPSPFAST